jgi:hypothetical protein
MLPVERSPGAIDEADTTAVAGDAEISTLPVVNVLEPTDWLSVKIAPVATTAIADSESARTASARPIRRRPGASVECVLCAGTDDSFRIEARPLRPCLHDENEPGSCDAPEPLGRG